jgi:hypothetical protein
VRATRCDRQALVRAPRYCEPGSDERSNPEPVVVDEIVHVVHPSSVDRDHRPSLALYTRLERIASPRPARIVRQRVSNIGCLTRTVDNRCPTWSGSEAAGDDRSGAVEVDHVDVAAVQHPPPVCPKLECGAAMQEPMVVPRDDLAVADSVFDHEELAV